MVRLLAAVLFISLLVPSLASASAKTDARKALRQAHPLSVETAKAAGDRGHYLYPEGFGRASSARIKSS